MKLWATSCLHLKPETNLSDRPRLEAAVRQMSRGDIVLLAGDIADPSPGIEGIRGDVVMIVWLAWLLKDQQVVYIPGNHDEWHRHYIPPGWRVLANTEHDTFYVRGRPYLQGFRGWNYPGPSWSKFHDIEDKDGALLEEQIQGVEKVSPTILATHYPFWWGEGTVSAKLDERLHTAGVRKVIFGHLHSPEGWIDRPLSLDGVELFNVAAPGRNNPFILVDEVTSG